jgi:AcrR family transcriptional regulator
MTEPALTRARILDAAQEALRRHGLAKANVVDVARALGVSHGSVYRFFPSKAALREAVTARFLHAIMAELDAIQTTPARARLHDWFAALAAAKRERLRQDPELFDAYLTLAAESRAVVEAHVAAMTDAVESILRAGIAEGSIRDLPPRETAAALLTATAMFHNPAHAKSWHDPSRPAAFETLWSLLLPGLTP